MNKPPEAFISIPGNIELNNDQINKDGTPPPGFGQPGFKFNNNMTENNQLEEVKENNERNDLKENQQNSQTYQKLNIYKSDLLPNQHN